MITITKSTPTDPVSLFSSHLIWWYLKIMMAGRGIGTLMLLMWIDCYFNILVLAELPRDAFSLILNFIFEYTRSFYSPTSAFRQHCHIQTHTNTTLTHIHTLICPIYQHSPFKSINHAQFSTSKCLKRIKKEKKKLAATFLWVEDCSWFYFTCWVCSM